MSPIDEKCHKDIDDVDDNEVDKWRLDDKVVWSRDQFYESDYDDDDDT